MLVSQGVLPFKLVVEDEPSSVTAHGGVPLVLEAMRVLVGKKPYRELRDALGFSSWRAVRRALESLVLLIAAGGDCLDDIRVLRADGGLCQLLGFEPSSPTQLKEWLYRFHQRPDGSRLSEQDDAELSQAGVARIREEGPGLNVLQAMCGEVVRAVQTARAHHRATLDVDAVVVEAQKKAALMAYEGTVGYQPQMAWWAEAGVWVLDEFRDGNVPAAFGLKGFLLRAFEQLPGSVRERRLRGDSALYNEDVLSWAHEAGIQFAVSADMTEALAQETHQIPEDAWKPYRSLKERDQSEETAEERQWADVPYFPNWRRNFKNGTTPFRYIAIRVRSRQKDLFEHASKQWRHFAVVTNMNWEGERLLRWHREKQGTVEHGHHVMVNELAAGTLPCGRFGANAAFWRINVFVHNVLQWLKIVALPTEMASCRPKALRFRLLHIAGRIIRHAGALWLKISSALPAAIHYLEARQMLLKFAT